MIKVIATWVCSILFSICCSAQQLNIDGSTGVKPLVESLAQHYQTAHPTAQFNIGKGMKPAKRIAALLTGDIDIAMASHGIDIQSLSEQGLAVHLIARVAVVFGINHTVAIDVISSEQVCRIYSGELTNWHELGADSKVIKPFLRPYDEVDTEVVMNNVKCFGQIEIASTIPKMKKSGQMARALAQNEGAIGMTTMVRVAQSNGNIVPLSLDGLSPIGDDLVNGRYPLTRDLFLITKVDASQSVRDFITFIKSQTGRAIVIRNNAAPANQ